MKENKSNFAQYSRLFGLFLMSSNYYTALVYFNPKTFLVPFTNWTLMFTTASIMLSYRAATDTKHFGYSSLVPPDKKASVEKVNEFKKTLKLQASHNFLYFGSLISNIVVMSVYWTILHEQALQEFGNNPGKRLHLYTVHVFPGFACLLNVISTNCVPKRSLWKAIIGVGVF